MMRKDYILIAEAINRAASEDTVLNNPDLCPGEPQAAAHAYHVVVESLCNAMEEQNPHFDRKRFKGAALDGVVNPAWA
jgi:hypothetical protein